MKQVELLTTHNFYLLFEPKFLDERAIAALVGRLEVLQMLAAVGNEPEEAAARMQILAIFIQMS